MLRLCNDSSVLRPHWRQIPFGHRHHRIVPNFGLLSWMQRGGVVWWCLPSGLWLNEFSECFVHAYHMLLNACRT